MSTDVTTLDPKIVEAAQKLIAKQALADSKREQNISTKYPFADVKTLTFDESANKYKVQCTCVETGKKFWSYTSDLFQTSGLHPDARKTRKKAERAEHKARILEALKLLAAQEKEANEFEGEEEEEEEEQVEETEQEAK